MHCDSITLKQLKSPYLKEKIKGNVEDIFKTCDNSFKNYKELGCIAVIIDNTGKYLASSIELKPQDILKIEKWGKNRRSDRLSDRVFGLVMSNSMFIFSKYRNTIGEAIILIGKIIEKNHNTRLMLGLVKARELPKFRKGTLVGVWA